MEVGIDIIENYRIEDILKKDENSIKKIFTENEIKYFNNFTNKVEHAAGFFCTKEAFSKCVKTGFSSKLLPTDIEVLHNLDGSPYINTLNPNVKRLVGNKKIKLSISHSKTISTSICIIE